LEIARHLSDAELIGATRFRMALAMPGAPLPSYDQNRFAEHLDYLSPRSGAIEEVMQLFDYLRTTTLRLLDAATDRWSASWGVHGEWGELTVRNLLELYADHGERHVAQIVEIRRRLKVPIALSPLLPVRLY
jgi:hypothetical protein